MKIWNSIRQENSKTTDTGFAMAEQKTLNFFDLTVLGLGSSIGVGVFVLIGELTRNVVGPAIVVSVAVAGVAAILGGLSFAEFGVFHLNSDSVYAYSYSWNKENVAFILGWALILEYIAGITSISKGIIFFIDALSHNKISNFLAETIPINFEYVSPYFDFVSLSLVVILMIALAFGMKDSMVIKKIFTLCTIVLMFIIIVAGSFKADLKNWHHEEYTEVTEGSLAPFGFVGVIKGAAIIFYGFVGFQAIGISGCDVKDTQKNIPFAILFTVIITIIGYIGVAAVLTLMSPYYKHNIHAAIPFAFEEENLTGVKWLVVVGAFFGFQTSLFGTLYPLPRIIYAMANDSLLFHSLSKKDSKIKAPVRVIAVGGLLSATAAGVLSFRQLVDLTVLSNLFISTILAMNVTFLRYTFEEDEYDRKLPENYSNVYIQKENFLYKFTRNCFNLSSNTSQSISEKIITWNTILFCFSCIGLSIIFVHFSSSLFSCGLESILPACALLILMLFNLISITRLPKNGKKLPFQVPFVPFVPCLSMFINIFLMATFEASTWIRFSIWMALGIIPHLIWTFLKCCRREVKENSRFEVNRLNTIKLNDSIWKIKLQKKSFYEGAINPAFNSDPDDSVHWEKNLENDNIKNSEAKTSLQLSQAEIIETADVVVVENYIEPIQTENDVDFTKVDNMEFNEKTSQLLQQEDKKVHWECVAEIHTEEEFPQESVVLQIVDNTYNFLSEVSEELQQKEILTEKAIDESRTDVQESRLEEQEVQNDNGIDREKEKKLNNAVFTINENQSYSSFTEELLNEVQSRINKRNHNKLKECQPLEVNTSNSQEKFDNNISNQEAKSQPQSQTLNNSEGSKNTDDIDILILKTLYETQKNEMTNNILNNNDENWTEQGENMKTDDQKKIKKFKEKLNQLLKNQVNINSSFTKNLLNSKSKNDAEEDNLMNKQEDENVNYKNIKTLNKSQIRNKLEMILSKGPPKRPSFRDSFNIKKNEVEPSENIKSNQFKEQNITSKKTSSKVNSGAAGENMMIENNMKT